MNKPMSSPFLLLVILLVASAAITYCSSLHNILENDDELYCGSWRLSVETGNTGPWGTIPQRCTTYVISYMTGPRYLSDSHAVTRESLAFASSLAPPGPLDAWVFDLDDTLISTFPYQSSIGFGSQGFNKTKWDEWVAQANATALPESLRLYEEVRKMGFRLVITTGREEAVRGLAETNLLRAGYTSWERFLMRNWTEPEVWKTSAEVKTEQRELLEAEGYKIHGNSGDQWTDLLGSAAATRSFKLPNPMYYLI